MKWITFQASSSLSMNLFYLLVSNPGNLVFCLQSNKTELLLAHEQLIMPFFVIATNQDRDIN